MTSNGCKHNVALDAHARFHAQGASQVHCQFVCVPPATLMARSEACTLARTRIAPLGTRAPAPLLVCMPNTRAHEHSTQAHPHN
eukprot:11196537-Alexandrium_andersonii.AAC.1